MQRRIDFIQLLMDAHKDPDQEGQEDKEYDEEFKKIYKGTSKRCASVSQLLQGTYYIFALQYFPSLKSVSQFIYTCVDI